MAGIKGNQVSDKFVFAAVGHSILSHRPRREGCAISKLKSCVFLWSHKNARYFSDISSFIFQFGPRNLTCISFNWEWICEGCSLYLVLTQGYVKHSPEKGLLRVRVKGFLK